MALEPDAILANAVDLARRAAEDVAGHPVGDHMGFLVDGERVGTHVFASEEPGYVGWNWSVTLARTPRSRTATINEVELLPGTGALLSPQWLPWAERLQPGDLGAGDVLPYKKDDDRLAQGYEQTDNLDADRLAVWELGLGRERVLSPEGRAEAFKRWYDGAGGPRSDVARKAKAQCSTCGFFMKMAGSARLTFGVCANEWSPSDGRVVAMNHGCGAHSETDVPKRKGEWQQSEPVINEGELEVIEVTERRAKIVEEPATDQPKGENPAEISLTEDGAANEVPDEAPQSESPATAHDSNEKPSVQAESEPTE